MDDKISILGVSIDKLTVKQAVQHIVGIIDNYVSGANQATKLIVTANPEIVMLAREDQEFAEIVKQAELVTADGIGLIVGAQILGRDLGERVTGIDLTTALLPQLAQKGHGIYLFGAKPGIAEKAAVHLLTENPKLNVVGWHHGYAEDEQAVIEDIKAKQPKVLLVALGMGKQEKWIWKHRFELGVPVAIGVGGSFDVFAGEVKRAPVWMQKSGLEWMYRLMLQPSRVTRMAALPKFLLKIVGQRLKDQS